MQTDAIVRPAVRTFFHEPTFTATHVVWDPDTLIAAVIDSTLDYDHKSGRTSTDAADTLIAFVRKQGLTVEWILETHAHADHLTAAPHLQTQLGGRIAIGEHIAAVQDGFGKVFNAGADFATDGSQFDHLFRDGDAFALGSIEGRIIHTPGHTPACVTYLLGDAAFVGDTLFMPDGGSARADFPGGDAGVLYDSIQKVLSLPDETRLFMCHDYGPNGRDIQWETTVGEEKAHNIHVGGGKTKEEFVKFRTERDAQLTMPRLIIPSLQVNMRGGELPPADESGKRFLKVPVNVL